MAGLLFALLLALAACEKEEEPMTAYGDAFVYVTEVNDSVVYFLSLYAYSWSPMKEVRVNRANNSEEITLDSLQYRYTYANKLDSGLFSPTPPESGTFEFHAVFDNNESHVSTDVLDTALLAPPVIKTVVFDSTDQEINLTWEKVSNDCAYKIALKEEGTLVFQSALYGPELSAFTITPYSSGWAYDKQPRDGDQFQVVLFAYLFEPVASAFDLQCVSVNEEHVVTWVNPYE